jgi:hypothetical protein
MSLVHEYGFLVFSIGGTLEDAPGGRTWTTTSRLEHLKCV